MLPLPIFPPESNAATVTVTVWVGVLIVVFFNLRFGWTLSGLVVPGYLVPLMMIKPIAVAIVLGEAIITYLLARLTSDLCRKARWWSSFFGRDRFLLIVLLSILVRAIGDGWLIPFAGKLANEHLGLSLDYRNDLHSYGLIVVALIANYFWKPRLWRGLTTACVTTGLTFAIVRYAIVEYTNFSVGQLQFLYEDVSTSLLSSPKSYVIVVTTAFIASQMNLRYSWDFNGILVPALLGLLWHEPLKIVVTLGEAAGIYILGSLLLALPIWRGLTMEGGRKLLLFFSLSAAHRLALAHILPTIDTNWQVTDAYGFGYLLATLIALKAHDKQIPLRVGRAVVQTSMMGAVAATLLGFGLTFIPLDAWSGRQPMTPDWLPEDPETNATLWQCLHRDRVRMYALKAPGSFHPALPGEIRQFRLGIAACLDYAERPQASVLRRARHHLHQAKYRLRTLEGRYLLIQESAPVHGWGTYVINCEAENGSLIEVPAPLDEWSTFESGFVLFQDLQAFALSLAGSSRTSNADRSSDMLSQPGTIMLAFHRQVDHQDTVQVRAWNDAGAGDAAGRRQATRQANALTPTLNSTIWVKRSLPSLLTESARWKNLVPACDVRWKTPPTTNVLRDQTYRGYAELVLSRADRRRLRNQAGRPKSSAPPQLELEEGYLTQWLLSERESLARRGTDEFVPALVEEMLFLDDEVLQPLISLARRTPSLDHLSSIEHERLSAINASAGALSYEVKLHRDLASGSDYFILTETADKPRHWGTFIFRAGLLSPYLVEVPRPLYEQQTFEFGISLFHQAEASSLSITGAHPFTNPDGTADVTRLANKVNLFQLVRQVMLREFHQRPMLAIQARAIQAPVNADLVIATDDGSFAEEELSPLVADVIRTLKGNNLSVRMVDGSADVAGYELGILVQSSSLNQSVNKSMVSLWLSPHIRRKFRPSDTQQLQAAQFHAVGIPTVEGDLGDCLIHSNLSSEMQPLSPQIAAVVRQYCQNRDVVHLARLRRSHPGHRFTRVVDPGSDQVFLTVHLKDTARAAFNISGALTDDRQRSAKFDAETVRDFARSRKFMLELGGTP